MASTEGGMEIEEVAAQHAREDPHGRDRPGHRLPPFHARQLAFGARPDGQARSARRSQLHARLYTAFIELDASLVEINPLVVTGAGDLVALDAKMNFDDNALFRHPEIEALRDLDEEDPSELEAAKHELNYVKLDGNIGCMVNGAGPGDGDDGHHQAVSAASRPTSSTSAAARPRSG